MEWNPRKNKNDRWVDKDSWLLKAWQEVIDDAKTTKMAINKVVPNKKDQSSSASELSKYLSKQKSKETRTRQRWYSFSSGYEGCKPKLKTYGSVFGDQKHIRPCTKESKCNCESLCIVWDFKHYSNVFINSELVKMMVKEGY